MNKAYSRARNAQAKSSVRPLDVAGYLLLPRILPRFSALFFAGFTYFAFFMAQVYRGARLLPASHPYLIAANIGSFGIRDVIGAAASHLVFRRENIDQIIIFFAILAGLVLLVLQAAIFIMMLATPQAVAQVSLANMFGDPMYTNVAVNNKAIGTSQDLAFIMMDRVFGVEGIFNSCISTNTPCYGIESQNMKFDVNNELYKPQFFPWPYHNGLHAMFMFYSTALLLVGMLIVIYYAIVVVVETAQTGTPFGKRFNSVWAPVRLVIAIGLLIPLGTGLNAAQYITLYAAKFGSNFASNGWLVFNMETKASASNLANSQGLVVEPQPPEVQNLIRFMIIAHACKAMEEVMPVSDWSAPEDRVQKARDELNKEREEIAKLKTDTDEQKKAKKAREDNLKKSEEGITKLVEGQAKRCAKENPNIGANFEDMNRYTQIEAYLVNSGYEFNQTYKPLIGTSYEDARKFSEFGDMKIRFGDQSCSNVMHSGFVAPLCGEIVLPSASLDQGSGRIVQEGYYNLIQYMWGGYGLSSGSSGGGGAAQTTPQPQPTPASVTPPFVVYDCTIDSVLLTQMNQNKSADRTKQPFPNFTQRFNPTTGFNIKLHQYNSVTPDEQARVRARCPKFEVQLRIESGDLTAYKNFVPRDTVPVTQASAAPPQSSPQPQQAGAGGAPAASPAGRILTYTNAETKGKDNRNKNLCNQAFLQRMKDIGGGTYGSSDGSNIYLKDKKDERLRVRGMAVAISEFCNEQQKKDLEPFLKSNGYTNEQLTEVDRAYTEGNYDSKTDKLDSKGLLQMVPVLAGSAFAEDSADALIVKNIIRRGANELKKEIEEGRYNVSPEAISRGWAAAGIWYNKIAQMNGSLLGAAWAFPRPTTAPRLVQVQAARQTLNADAIQSFASRAGGNNPMLASNSDDSLAVKALQSEIQKLNNVSEILQPSTGNIFGDIISNLFGLDGLFNMRSPMNQNAHPLAQLVGVGKGLIEASIRNLTAGVMSGGAGILSAGFEGLGSGSGWGKAASGVTGVLNSISGLMFSVATITLTAGFILYYVVPFLPFLYFFFAVGNWLKGVFEAMVGVPLWALAHLRIDGDGLPGEAAINGYFMLFEIFLRPILIVFGLLASVTIFAAMGAVLHDVYDTVIGNLTGANPEEGSTASVDNLFYTIMYAVIMYMMALSSFKLIDLIPNQIMRWMGTNVSTFSDQAGDPAQTLTQYTAIAGSQIVGQVTQGTQSFIQGMQGSARSAGGAINAGMPRQQD